ncbi:MAG: PAS domain S-box protein, partial [Deltaproteobacteria bacterium]|nr:PAS domain S-box protein [Deltaproteobacteria bacterium]
MPVEFHPDMPMSRVAPVCALITAGMALIALTGWVLDVSILNKFSMEYIPMAPSTALAFLIFSCALFAHSHGPSRRIGSSIVLPTAVLILAWSMLILTQFITGSDLGLERWLVYTPETFGMVPAGRMSPITALIFMLGGLSLLFVRLPAEKVPIAQDVAASLALGVIAGGLLVILGYWYQTPLLSGGGIIPVAVPTAISFVFLGLGLLVPSGRYVWTLRGFVSVLISLGVGILVSGTMFIFVEKSEQTRIQTKFEHDAANLVTAVVRSVQHSLDELESIGRLFSAAGNVTRDEFRVFLADSFADHSIQAFSWDPVVSDAERAAYESAAQRDGFWNFKFTELNAQNELVTAGRRRQYVVVYYIEPYVRNERALGFDVTSNPSRTAALEKARDTEKMTATLPVKLVQQTDNQPSVLINRPIYRRGMPHGTVEERQANLAGFAVGIIRVADMVGASLRGLNREGIEISLYDRTNTTDQGLLYASAGIDVRKRRGLHWATSFNLADRPWVVQAWLPSSYLAARHRLQAWNVLPTGLLLTILLGAYLLASVRHGVETRQSAEVLRSEKDLISRITETSPVGILVLDRQGKIVSVNNRAEQVFGLTKDELTQRAFDAATWGITDYAGNQAGAEALPCWQALQTGRSVFDMRLAMADKDGRRMLTSVNCSPLFDQTGEPVGMVATVADITRQIQAEQELQESEEKYRALIETTDTGYVILDQEGQVLEANAVYVGMTGHDRLDQILGKNVVEWTAEHDRERNAREVQKCIERKSVRSLEVDYVQPDGRIIPLEINATLMEMAEGNKILSLCRDITPRRQAERALRQSEEKYRHIFETAPVGIFHNSVEGQGKIIDANPALARILGYESAQELISVVN